MSCRVEVFFVFHPHANRLFHAPSFMSTLSLPPSHPKFPATPVLHAICAIGSLYTAAVTSPPLPNFAEVDPGTKGLQSETASRLTPMQKMRSFHRDIELRSSGPIRLLNSKRNVPGRLPSI